MDATLTKQSPQEILNSSKQQLDAENYDGAIKLLSNGVEQFPANPLLSANLGMAYLRAGSRDHALHAFRQAHSKSQNPPEWFGRGITALEQQTVMLHGVKLAVPQDVVSIRVLRYLIEGSYEGRERTMLRNNINVGDRVLELGAGLGYLACVTGHEYSEVDYVAIEANPRLISTIKLNFKANNCRAKLLYGVAATETGTSNFNIAEDFWASSSCPVKQSHEFVSVPSIDVNAVIREFHPTVMMIDIEGGELELVPQLDLFDVHRVIMELHPDNYGHLGSTTVIRSMLDAGFMIDVRQSGGQVMLFMRD